MSIQLLSNHSSFPTPFSQGCSLTPSGAYPSLSHPCPCPCPPIDPKNPEVWDYGFKRVIAFWQSPALGAGILAITFFFLIAFFSNVLLELVNPMTLGITVTIGTLGLLTLIILILFFL